MKVFARNFYYSFPIQLLLLHFRKSQILLLFWLVLFLTITGHFLKLFGADALFLAPEYLGNVNAAGAAIIGVAMGIFMMSWNITTFIIHSSRCRFLATTSNPFLKYCLNNALIPAAFLIVYFINALNFGLYKELIPLSQFLLNVGGFVGGFILLLLISFAYFFTALSQSCIPRPAGLSGAVITAAISYPASYNLFSEGTANSGVPIKTILKLKAYILTRKIIFHQNLYIAGISSVLF